jgi:hypothetical protein
MEQQVLTTLRDQVGPIMLGTVFLFVGVVACALAPIRGLKEKGHSPVVWPAEHHVWSSHSGLSADSVQHASSDLVGQPPRCYCDSLLRDRGSRAAFLSGNESWNPAPNPANHVARGFGDLPGGNLFRPFYRITLPLHSFSNVVVVALVLIITAVVWVPSLSERFGFARHWVSQLGLNRGVVGVYGFARGKVDDRELRPHGWWRGQGNLIAVQDNGVCRPEDRGLNDASHPAPKKRKEMQEVSS